MSNKNLSNAKKAKNDEFYTHYDTIDAELLSYDAEQFRDKVVLCPCDDPVESNFTLFFAKNFNHLGLRKLISTGYKKDGHGKKYILEGDTNGDGVINQRDIVAEDLEGDGDFNSEEVTALRDEADIICTNPPFSLWRDFLHWINPDEKKFIILGNMNAITYKEIFPLIKDNKIWLGVGTNRSLELRLPDSATSYKYILNGIKYGIVPACTWFTNMVHRGRHERIILSTRAENEMLGVVYQHYDNYDAIEVPETKLIPSDYTGVMGVPVSFLDKYSPEQFEILGHEHDLPDGSGISQFEVNGESVYKRILIRNKFNS